MVSVVEPGSVARMRFRVVVLAAHMATQIGDDGAAHWTGDRAGLHSPAAPSASPAAFVSPVVPPRA